MTYVTEPPLYAGEYQLPPHKVYATPFTITVVLWQPSAANAVIVSAPTARRFQRSSYQSW